MPCRCPDCRAAGAGEVTPEEPARERCRWCGAYEDRCECATCPECGESEHEVSFCHECGHCREHCACTDRIPFCENPTTFHGEPSTRYPRYVGAEIECVIARAQTRNYRKVADKWNASITDDGSVYKEGLPGHSAEHVTAPARGAAFEDQIHDTLTVLHAQGAAVNKTCGLHVHVDARDYTAAHILAFARLYSRVEKTLYAMVSRARRGNIYSKPWGDKAFNNAVATSEGFAAALDDSQPLTAREKALDIVTYGSENTARRMKETRSKHSSRYHGVNFNALAIHQTIEFRLHHGTLNETKILMWSAVCSALVEYAATHSEEEIKALRGSPAEILDRVINDPAVSLWCRKRRQHFDRINRERRGLPPRARAVTPPAAPAPVVPDMPVESGEETAIAPRGRPMFR